VSTGSITSRRTLIFATIVGVVAASTAALVGVAQGHTNDECATVRAQVAAQELVNTAAEQQGGLTSGQRSWIANERGVAAKALLHCQPIIVPSTSPSIISPPPFSPPPSPSVSATPSPTPTGVPGAWPGPTNTGVPAGTTLSAYTGPCVITTPNTVIDAKIVNCDLTILTTGVRITRSQVNGAVGDDENSAYSFTISDSEIIATTSANIVEKTGLGADNFTATRVEVRGGNRGVYCKLRCTLQDS